jgi:hypothetical protein
MHNAHAWHGIVGLAWGMALGIGTLQSRKREEARGKAMWKIFYMHFANYLKTKIDGHGRGRPYGPWRGDGAWLTAVTARHRFDIRYETKRKPHITIHNPTQQQIIKSKPRAH